MQTDVYRNIEAITIMIRNAAETHKTIYSSRQTR